MLLLLTPSYLAPADESQMTPSAVCWVNQATPQERCVNGNRLIGRLIARVMSSTVQHLVGSLRRDVDRCSMSWLRACAGEDDEEDVAGRPGGPRSPPSRALSESGGSQDFEDGAREAMQEMLGAQEWHQVSLLL